MTCVKGTNQDTSLIADLASQADIVLNAADADDAGLLAAILDGCKKKFTNTGSKVVYIHTSGTAIFKDNAAGDFDPLTPIYNVRALSCLSAPTNDVHRIRIQTLSRPSRPLQFTVMLNKGLCLRPTHAVSNNRTASSMLMKQATFLPTSFPQAECMEKATPPFLAAYS